MKKKLAELEYGEVGIIKSVEADNINKLSGMGIRPGKKLKMYTKQPIEGPVVFTLNDSAASVGIGIAEKIQVEVEG